MALGVLKGSLTKSGTSQTITTSFKVKAAILFGKNIESTGTGFQSHAGLTIGISDGTTHSCAAQLSEDNIGSSDTYAYWNSVAWATFTTTTGAVMDTGTIAFGETTGATITWTNGGTPKTPLIHYILLGGDDITNVKVKQEDVTALGGNKSYTGYGFQGDFFFFLHSAHDITAYATTTRTGFAVPNDMGFGVAQSSTKRWAVSSGGEDQRGTSNTDRAQLTNRCIVYTNSALTVTNGIADFVSADSDGYTLNFTEAATGLPDFSCLAIKGGKWDCGSLIHPDGTGNQDTNITTGVTAKLLAIASFNNVANSGAIAHNRMSLGAVDNAANQGYSWLGDLDAAGDMINACTDSTTETIGLHTEADTHTSSTTQALASLATAGLDTAGKFTLNWTTIADTTDRELVWFTAGIVSRTPVSNESTQLYNLRNYVSQELTQKYNDRMFVALESTQKWNDRNFTINESTQLYNITNYVSQDSTQLYDLREYVNEESTQLYNVNEYSSNEPTQLYNIRNSISQESTQLFNINEFVSVISTQLYNVREYISNESIQLYNLREYISAISTQLYNITNFISNESTQLYNVREFISAISTQLYNVKAFVSNISTQLYNIREYISNESTQLYNLRELVSKISTQLYNVRHYINQESTQLYNIKEFVSAISTQLFNVKEFVSAISTQLYNVLVNERTFVSNELIQKYNVKSFVDSISIQQYNLREFINQESVQLYNLRNYVSEELIQLFNVREFISAISTQLYNVKEYVSQISTQLYNLTNYVNQESIQKYNLTNYVNKESIQKYNLREFVNEELTQLYNIREFITAISIQLYHVITSQRIPVSNELTQLYNVRNFVSQELTQKYNVLKLRIPRRILNPVHKTEIVNYEELERKFYNYIRKVGGNSWLGKLKK